jgi:multicomponent Na+:H+ antiporter subunit G
VILAKFIFCIVVGTFFLFIAALGILRLPDAYCRMHASTKAASLGIGFVVLATALFFADTEVSTKALMIVVFIFLTAPVAGHLLGRAAHVRSDPQRAWEKDD